MTIFIRTISLIYLISCNVLYTLFNIHIIIMYYTTLILFNSITYLYLLIISNKLDRFNLININQVYC